jgi:hypothetical protein
MTGPSFQEAQAAYTHASDESFVGQVRRFGPHGPAYEVLRSATVSSVEIIVIESGERLAYALSDMLADPMAETIP